MKRSSEPHASYERGKRARRAVPRSAHAEWSAGALRSDPLAILADQDRQRVPSLVPIRRDRMAASAFSYYRGAAAVMAADLALTPATGERVQAAGDAHLANFGAFATPERRFVFDVNDFDETLPAPWEWDLKRLAASAVLAAREVGLPSKRGRAVAAVAARAYRETIARCAQSTALAVWTWRIDAAELVARLGTDAARAVAREERVRGHRARSREHLSSALVVQRRGKPRIADDPPLVSHVSGDASLEAQHGKILAGYAQTLPDDVRVLFERYRAIDMAMKVVGVGSVGTRCALVLLEAAPGDLLLLQIKEAMASVLEPFAGASRYGNHGRRVVAGQRLLQTASDTFLAWTSLEDRDYYVRHFHDMKAAVDLERMRERDLRAYAALCGTALAIGHARSGDAAFVAGYAGRGTALDDAIAEFAQAYADQTEADYRRFIA